MRRAQCRELVPQYAFVLRSRAGFQIEKVPNGPSVKIERPRAITEALRTARMIWPNADRRRDEHSAIYELAAIESANRSEQGELWKVSALVPIAKQLGLLKDFGFRRGFLLRIDI